jgi:hypothetical protein
MEQRNQYDCAFKAQQAGEAAYPGRGRCGDDEVRRLRSNCVYLRFLSLGQLSYDLQEDTQSVQTSAYRQVVDNPAPKLIVAI